MDARQRAEAIERALARIGERYVFPRVAEQVAEEVRRRLAEGEYDGLDDASLCASATAHMQAVSRDKHLALVYSAEPREAADVWGRADPAWVEARRIAMPLENHGIARVERLDGNVGYLDLRSFPPPQVGGDTVAAAMAFVAHCWALIVDLRRSVGGNELRLAAERGGTGADRTGALLEAISSGRSRPARYPHASAPRTTR